MSDWISVKESLPPMDVRIETVDMNDPFPEMTCEHMGVNNGDLFRWNKSGRTPFTHWRCIVLPSPPSTEEGASQ